MLLNLERRSAKARISQLKLTTGERNLYDGHPFDRFPKEPVKYDHQQRTASRTAFRLVYTH